MIAGGVHVAVITGRVDGRLSTLSVNRAVGRVWSGASDELQYCMGSGGRKSPSGIQGQSLDRGLDDEVPRMCYEIMLL